jgi:hypothetical protein
MNPESAFRISELDAARLNGEEFKGSGAAREAEEITRMAFIELVCTLDVDDGAGRTLASGYAWEKGQLMPGGAVLDEDDSCQPLWKVMLRARADLSDQPIGFANDIAGSQKMLAGWLGELLHGGGVGDQRKQMERELSGAERVQF